MKKVFILFSALFSIISISPSIIQAQELSEYIDLISSKSGVLYVEGATRIDIHRAYQLHQEGILFIDVNSPRGYKAAHIPGAISLDIKTTLKEESLAEHATHDQELVFYCPHIDCWGAAHAAAKSMLWGYTKVFIFDGGAKEWAKAGYPVENG